MAGKGSIAVITGGLREVVRMAPIIRALRSFNDIKVTLIHLSPSYLRESHLMFFSELDLPEPDHFIDVQATRGGLQTAQAITGCVEIFEREWPNLVINQGYSNTSLGVALAAIKMQIPYGHVDAGLFTETRNIGEKINRQLIDRCTDLCFTPSERAFKNLLNEGISPHKIYLTGSPIVEATKQHSEIAMKNSRILKRLGLTSKENIFVLVRSPINVRSFERLSRIIEAVLMLSDYSIILHMDATLRKALSRIGVERRIYNAGHIIQAVNPTYLDRLKLILSSSLVISDSREIEEEAYSLNRPYISLLPTLGYVEARDLGYALAVDNNPFQIVEAVSSLIERNIGEISFLGDEKSGRRIAEVCHENIPRRFGWREVEAPTFGREYKLVKVKELSKLAQSYRILCYYDRDGRPVDPKASPKSSWKALLDLSE